MKNENFSHFGVEEEYQKHYDKRIEPRKQAKFDGYSFGDRLLEGVMFIATIQDDGTMSVAVDPRHENYFNQLNTTMWLEKALDFAMRNDVFEGMDGVEDINLIMTNGKPNFIYEREQKENKVHPGIDMPVPPKRAIAMKVQFGNSKKPWEK